MEKNDDKSDEDLVTIQNTIEIAASEVAHHTKAERETIAQSTPESVKLRDEVAARCTKKDREESAEETSQKSKG